MAMNLYCYMVTHNEADRYLASCLSWNGPQVHGIAVYDDCSTDDTVDLARHYGAKVCKRSTSVPSFLEHEGKFRQAAWEWMQDVFDPDESDWILALDADEFVVGDLHSDIVHQAGGDAVELSISEVFDAHGPKIRVDGFWRKISAVRLFRWRPDALFTDRKMGCGSAPTYACEVESWRAESTTIMHYGYADYNDRLAKFARYTNVVNHGHNPDHIQSILRQPELNLWTGQVPDVRRGHP